MIRAANHSSYPRAGEHSYDRHLPDVLERHARGEATESEVRGVEDEVATLVVAEQSRAFIDVVTDGLVRWDGYLTHTGRHLEGVEVDAPPHGPWRGFEGPGPRVVGAIRRREAFLVDEYLGAAAVGAKATKMVLPGPVTFARSCDDRHYGDPGALARAVAAAWAEEVAALAAAGCTVFQLDEPAFGRDPGDVELVSETAGCVFAAAGAGATTILSTWGCDLAAVADRLDVLPGTHFGLDATTAANVALIAGLPPGRGVHLGLFDACSAEVEDAADVAERLLPFRSSLEARDVMVGPQSGLGSLGRDAAFEKLMHARYLAESLRKSWGQRG